MKTKLFILIMVFNTQLFAQENFDKQGHRGCRGLMPENTIAAMKKALDLGVNTLEMDVVITRDNLPLVSHEPFMSAAVATSPDGREINKENEQSFNLYQLDYEAIKKFDVGLKFNKLFPDQKKVAAYKPLLSDLIDSIELYVQLKGYKKPFYNIETKCDPKTDNIFHPKPDEFVYLMMQVINGKNLNERVTIQSFDPRSLEIIKKDYPLYKTSLLVENKMTLTANLARLSFKPDFYSPYYKLITAENVDLCHSKGIKIIPWTVNSKAEIDKLTSLGVDGIITDYPNLFFLK